LATECNQSIRIKKRRITFVWRHSLYRPARAYKKVLKDEDYVAGLDEASGPRWLVYASMAKQGRMKYPSLPSSSVDDLYH
jgi:hypothetical protein